MEIEIRAKVDSLEDIQEKLRVLGAKLSDPIDQKDKIFKKKGTENEIQGPGSFILRLRKTGEKAKLTFKALTEVTGVWDEHDLEISSFEEMEQILLKIGFTEQLRLNKTRTKCKLGEITVCLDKIQELEGNYIEAEIISNNQEEGKKKLIELLGKIGINENQIEHRGYVAMLFERKGVKFNKTG